MFTPASPESEDSRPQKIGEIVVIDRRSFLRLAGGTLISLTGFGLLGCGGGGAGGGGSASSGQAASVTGSIQFPTGFTAKTGNLTVVNGLGNGKVGTNLGFNIHALDSSPSLVIVQDASGSAIFYGFINPISKTNVIGSTSSAVALLYFALGVYAFPEESRAQILGLIAQDPATLTFAKVISARVLVNPFALGQSDAQIGAALNTAFNTINTSIGAKGASRPITAHPSDGPLTAMTLQPSGQQSGFEINQDSGSVGFIGTNHYQRECVVNIYETAKDNVALTEAKTIGTPIAVKSPSKLIVFGALTQVYEGSSTAFVPINTAVVPLALEAGSKETTYEIVVLGAGKQALASGIGDPNYPSFWEAPRYSELSPEWGITVRGLTLKTCIIDVFLGFFLELLEVNSATSDALDKAADQILEIKDPAWQAAIEEFLSLKFTGAIVAAMTAMVSNEEVFEEVLLAVGPIISSLQLSKLSGYIATQTPKSAFNLFAKTFYKMMLVGNVLCVGGSVLAVSHDLLSSNVGELWTATLVSSSLTLNPTAPTIAPGATVVFNAKLPTGTNIPPGDTVVYDWSQTGGILSILNDEHGQSGQSSIETALSTVNLITTPSQQAPITVTVSAYLKRTATGAKTLIDTAKANVKLQQGPILAVDVFAVPFPDTSNPPIYNMVVLGMLTFTVDPSVKVYDVELHYTNPVNQTGVQIADQVEINANVPVSTTWAEFGTSISGNPTTWTEFQYPVANRSPIGLNVVYVTTGAFYYNLGNNKIGMLVINPTKVAIPDPNVNPPYPTVAQVEADTKAYAQLLFADFKVTAKL